MQKRHSDFMHINCPPISPVGGGIKWSCACVFVCKRACITKSIAMKNKISPYLMLNACMHWKWWVGFCVYLSFGTALNMYDIKPKTKHCENRDIFILNEWSVCVRECTPYNVLRFMWTFYENFPSSNDDTQQTIFIMWWIGNFPSWQ